MYLKLLIFILHVSMDLFIMFNFIFEPNRISVDFETNKIIICLLRWEMKVYVSLCKFTQYFNERLGFKKNLFYEFEN